MVIGLQFMEISGQGNLSSSKWIPQLYSGSSGHIQPRTSLNAPCSITGDLLPISTSGFPLLTLQAQTTYQLIHYHVIANTQMFLSQIPQAMRHSSIISPPLIMYLPLALKLKLFLQEMKNFALILQEHARKNC